MKNIFLIIIISLTFNGCIINGVPKAKDWAEQTIGSDINYRLEREKDSSRSGNPYVRGWIEAKQIKDYYLTNGNLVHIHPIRENCLIHWEVDKDTNKIIDYKFEGDKCY